MVRCTCLLRLIMIDFVRTELCIFTVKTLTDRWALNKGKFWTSFWKFSCFHSYAGRTFFNIFGTKFWQIIQTSYDILLNIFCSKLRVQSENEYPVKIFWNNLYWHNNIDVVSYTIHWILNLWVSQINVEENVLKICTESVYFILANNIHVLSRCHGGSHRGSSHQVEARGTSRTHYVLRRVSTFTREGPARFPVLFAIIVDI